MEDKTIWQLSWQERYNLSRELAVRAIESGLSTFICVVDSKYKSTIWNEAKRKLKRRNINLNWNMPMKNKEVKRLQGELYEEFLLNQIIHDT